MSKLKRKTKLIYGLGFSSRGIKDGLFQLFLFFYFSQVLGLDAALAGTASIIALLFDAVSDPLVGLISDGWKSKKWGRRHPFMFVSAFPLGISTWLLFMPPGDITQTGLFLWLTIFSILVRLFLTFFIIPHMSLGAELTTDYKERTTITSYRIMFASFISPLTIFIGLTFFFRPTEQYTHGLFNLEAYPKFAFFCAVLMIVAILLSTWGTRHVIPSLPKYSEGSKKRTISSVFVALGKAVKMRSFYTLVLYVMVTYISIGIGVTFTTYFATYYFELSEIEIAALLIGSALGGIIALAIAPSMGDILDKKWATFIASIGYGTFFTLPFNLRSLGWFPENDSSLLLPIYVTTLVIAYTFLWSSMSLANSMMADVIDEYQLSSGTRQEGLFFSSMSFAYKCTTGIGMFISGLLLNWIAFPKQIDVSEVTVEAIEGLGFVGGPVLMTFYLSAVVFLLFYPITKARFQQIREQLEIKV